MEKLIYLSFCPGKHDFNVIRVNACCFSRCSLVESFVHRKHDFQESTTREKLTIGGYKFLFSPVKRECM